MQQVQSRVYEKKIIFSLCDGVWNKGKDQERKYKQIFEISWETIRWGEA